ncbi:DDE-type integrase/transposase/recombinase [Cloacibacterium sp.]|uniref:DDE-type integrase/transposase/recombinase n=1 Tax=Cloacibacterium sp. TaxID=1913682 RepID=UPI0039E3BF9E
MQQSYSRYHTNVKLCYSPGIEKQIFPKEFTDKIPATTSHYWKNKNVNDYLGYEYEELSAKAIEDFKILFDARAKKIKQLFFAFLKLYLSIITIIGKTNIQEILKINRKKLIPNIDSLINEFGNKKMILKKLGITVQQYAHWKKLEQYVCPNSLIWLCYHRAPTQISMKEIGIMKKLMTDKTMLHWASASVWGYGVKNGMISMARTTWYHYCKLLRLGENRKKYKPKKKKISIRAEAPNRIWHMDVSVYKTLENTKYYIYTIVDNFSRKILAYDYAKELNGSTRLKSLKRAIEQEFGVDLEVNQIVPKLELIVDGGTENNNKTVEDFIKENQINITKLVALKDIVFSNSMVESSFRMMKTYYLKQGIPGDQFIEELKFSIEDINTRRPHYAHLIYTPEEIHQNPELKQTKPFLQKVNQNRIAENKSYSCEKGCT